VAVAAFDTIGSVPDPGVWLLFATQPPFSSVPLDHVYPVARISLRSIPSLVPALTEADVALRWWDRRLEQFRADPSPGSRWAVNRPHPEPPPLSLVLPPGGEALRPSAGWSVRFPERPGRVRLVFVTPAMVFAVEARPDPTGVVTLSAKKLTLLAWLSAIRRTTRVLAYAESPLHPTKPDGPVRRTRPFWISIHG
jgi:hypothetical protein